MTVWRLIESGTSNAFYNMALDEAVAAGLRKGQSPPVLRFYAWDRPSVSIGRFQKAGDLDLRYCRQRDIPVVRRPTGGRGILHGHELTYSFSAKTKDGSFEGGLLDSYRKLSAAFSRALSMLGLSPETRGGNGPRRQENRPRQQSPLCFQSTSYGEITLDGAKVIGSAQKRWPDGLLQQGSIPYSTDYRELEKIFGLKHTENPMPGLTELAPGLRPEGLKEAIKASFEEVFDITLIESCPTAGEEALAEKLLAEKYLRPRWNLGR